MIDVTLHKTESDSAPRVRVNDTYLNRFSMQ